MVMPGQAAEAVRKQPLLIEAVTSSFETDGKNGGSKGRLSRMGETAGECAAVCCCFPCGMMHLLILAVYRIPAGIWRRKRRSRLLSKRSKFLSSEEKSQETNYSPALYFYTDEEWGKGSSPNDAVEWENEIWEGFGFWRSHSEKVDD